MGTLDKLIKHAKVSLGEGLGGIEAFCASYFAAVEEFGQDAEVEFAKEFPAFGDREWKRFLLVGQGRLLPVFLFRSDAFIAKLLRQKNPMDLQKGMVSCTPDASAETSRNINRDIKPKFGPPWKIHGEGPDAYLRIERGFRVDSMQALEMEYWKMRAALKNAKSKK